MPPTPAGIDHMELDPLPAFTPVAVTALAPVASTSSVCALELDLALAPVAGTAKASAIVLDVSGNGTARKAVVQQALGKRHHAHSQTQGKRTRSDMGTSDRQAVVATARAGHLLETPISTLQLDLGTVQESLGPVDKFSKRKGRSHATRAKFSEGLGKEFAKHKAYREVNRMATETGWVHSEALGKHVLPEMPDRMKDLLHIIWLFLEQHGIDPKCTDQIWHLDQSLIRGEWDTDSVYRKLPNIPGLGLRRQGGISAAVLPHSCMWATRFMRFLTGVEMMQLQGVPISQCPFLLQEPNHLCKKIAGNLFSIPCIGRFLLTAIVRHAHQAAGTAPVAATAMVAKAVAAVATMVSLQSLAEDLVSQLFAAWPDCFQGVPPVTLSFGTLCSGLDIVKPLLLALVAALEQRLGGPRVNVVFRFGCEIDPGVRRLRDMVANDPCYEDVSKLPEDIDFVDMLLAGFSCKSVSHQNNKPRSILKDDQDDPLTSSGRTFGAVCKYVAAKQPRIVILENVIGLFRKIPLSECHGDKQPRNIDIVMQRLAACGHCGYHVGYTLVNARTTLPQQRARVYIWAERKSYGTTDDEVSAAWQSLLGHVKPSFRLSLDACLLRT